MSNLQHQRGCGLALIMQSGTGPDTPRNHVTSHGLVGCPAKSRLPWITVTM